MDNKIPDGATHLIADVYSLSEKQKRTNDKHPYRKIKDGVWYAFVNSGWWPVIYPKPSRYQRIEKKWSGPQDGLPPVSSVVMARRPDNNQWIKCEVLKHGMTGQASQVCAFMEIKTNRMFWSNDYEVVKTEEQIASDLRESKIVEFMDTVGVDCRVTATKAVDAGYVRESK